jgi:hypothetical protein
MKTLPSIAQTIARVSFNSHDAMLRGERLAVGEPDQDWQNEQTIYTFADGSELTVENMFWTSTEAAR